MQMKLGVTERVVQGVVTHVRGDDPTAPTKVEVHIQPEGGGDEVRVKPEHIVQVLHAPSPVYREPSPDMRDRVTNTTQEAFENPLLPLIGAMDDRARGRGQGSFIEDMEARGQRELTSQTSKLPTEGSKDPAWAKMGVLYGEPDKDDPKFSFVQLPAGWVLRPTDHSMWNQLLDDKGRVRGKMFYKAAFYDRRATIHPVTRYQCDRESKIKDDYDCPFREVVKDTATGAALFMTDWVERPVKYTPEDLAREGAARKQTAAWLDANRPEWKDASAYWGWD